MADFLDSYFKGLGILQDAYNNKQQQAKNQQELELQQQRLAWEQSSHAADMKQRADQFGQEQSYRDAVMKQGQQDRETASQDSFTKGGGFAQAKPVSQPFPFQTGGPSQPPDLAAFAGLKPGSVGPQVSGMDSNAMAQSLPLRSAPVIPMMGELTSEAQKPDASMATPTTGPLGANPNLDYYQKTPGALAQEKDDATQVNWPRYTPSMAKFIKSVAPDIEPPWEEGDKMNPNDVQTFRTMADLKSNIDAKSKAGEDTRTQQLLLESMKENSALNIEAIKAANKATNGVTPDLADANHKSVMNNPDSFHELSPKEKSAEREQLSGEGLPAPVKLNPTQLDQEQYARRARTSIDNINKVLENPRLLGIVKKRSGAVLGRVGELEQDVGATSGLSPEDSRFIQDFRSSIRYLTFQEGKSLFGSRIPTQLMTELKATSPKTTETIDMLKGSMDAVNRNAENTLIADENTRFGGKMRPDFYQRNNIKGRQTQEVPAPNFPSNLAASLTEDDTPKVFSGAKGDRTFVKRKGQVFEIQDK